MEKKLTPIVSVIIPNYNGEKILDKNIPVLLEEMAKVENRIKEVIVVDDCSKDNSVELLKSKYPQVKIIKHKVNRGFSSAVNTGVRSSRGEIIVLLNSDVLPKKSFLAPVFKTFDDNKVFAVSLNEEHFSWAKGSFKDGFVEHGPGEKGDKIHTTFWASGGSSAYRRDLWIKLGGMDEKIFSPFYWEDIDLSYRALKRGYRIYWEPDAQVVHEHETTIGTLPRTYVERIRERNQLLFIWKNISSKRLIRKHLLGLGKRVLRHPGYLRIVLMALKLISPVMKARKREIKDTKVSDEAIFQSLI